MRTPLNRPLTRWRMFISWYAIEMFPVLSFLERPFWKQEEFNRRGVVL